MNWGYLERRLLLVSIITSLMFFLVGSSYGQLQRKNLVLLLRFSDHVDRALPSKADFETLLNSPTTDAVIAPSGSMRSYFLRNSYGNLDVESVVTEWITLDHPESYYAGGNYGLAGAPKLRDEAVPEILTQLDTPGSALQKANPHVKLGDFVYDGEGKINSVTIFHSGRGAEVGGVDDLGAEGKDRLWSHSHIILRSWRSPSGFRADRYALMPALRGKTGQKISALSLSAHEYTHIFKIPDLYDYDDSNGDGNQGRGVANHCVMGDAFGADPTGKYPAPLCAWVKVELGWVNPTLISEAGTYTIEASNTSSQVYKIKHGYGADEYLLIENRTNTNGKGGLAIYHIDESAQLTEEGYPGDGVWPAKHYKVALKQADGEYDLEKGKLGDLGDYYSSATQSELGPDTVPSSDSYDNGVLKRTGVRIYDISVAGQTMTFKFEILATAPVGPGSLLASNGAGSLVQLSWSDESGDEDGFILERGEVGGAFTELIRLPAGRTSFLDTTALSGKFYQYKVYSFIGNSVSVSSNVASLATRAFPFVAGGDSDGDGVSDLVEHYLGTDPESFNVATQLEVLSDGGMLLLHSVNANPVVPLSVSYQWSLNMKDWYVVNGGDGPVGGGTVSGDLSVPGRPKFMPDSVKEKIFFRIKVDAVAGG